MFLPDDYKAPAGSKNYMKIVDGENRFRILSAPILGWQDWTLDKKPVRFRYQNKPLNPIDPKKPIRHFWAFVVFNYADEMIQVLEITQATIRKAIENLSKDSDWGAPYFYDIKISRKGEGTDTDYVVTPTPKKNVDAYIVQEFRDKPCYLEALYDGADPFDMSWPMKTPGIFSMEDTQKKLPSSSGIPFITSNQVSDIRAVLFEDANTDEALKSILKRCQCDKLENMTTDKFEKAFAWAKKRIDDQKSHEDLPF